jgi:hypothetical protein
MCSIVMNLVYDTEFTPNAPAPLHDCEYLNITSGIVYYRYETVWNLVTENFYGLGDVTRNESSIKTITFTDPGLDYLLVDKAMDDAGACVLSLTEEHVYGKAQVHMRVSHQHVEPSGVEVLYESNVTFRIWFPDEVDMAMSDYYFDAIAGASNPDNCTQRLYQRAAVTATAVFSGYDLTSEGNIDVLPYVSFMSSDTGIATVSSATVYGKSPGEASIYISSGNPALAAERRTVYVRDEEVQVARLDPVLCNAANWSVAPSPLSLNTTEQFTAAVTFKQQLLAEFDAGDIYTYVLLTRV